MTTISKTTYTFTVLHPTDQPPLGLHDAIEEAEGGHAVGLDTDGETVEVPDADVPDELVAMGNDGTFFDFELGRED